MKKQNPRYPIFDAEFHAIDCSKVRAMALYLYVTNSFVSKCVYAFIIISEVKNYNCTEWH